MPFVADPNATARFIAQASGLSGLANTVEYAQRRPGDSILSNPRFEQNTASSGLDGVTSNVFALKFLESRGKYYNQGIPIFSIIAPEFRKIPHLQNTPKQLLVAPSSHSGGVIMSIPHINELLKYARETFNLRLSHEAQAPSGAPQHRVSVVQTTGPQQAHVRLYGQFQHSDNWYDVSPEGQMTLKERDPIVLWNDPTYIMKNIAFVGIVRRTEERYDHYAITTTRLGTVRTRGCWAMTQHIGGLVGYSLQQTTGGYRFVPFNSFINPPTSGDAAKRVIVVGRVTSDARTLFTQSSHSINAVDQSVVESMSLCGMDQSEQMMPYDAVVTAMSNSRIDTCLNVSVTRSMRFGGHYQSSMGYLL